MKKSNVLFTAALMATVFTTMLPAIPALAGETMQIMDTNHHSVGFKYLGYVALTVSTDDDGADCTLTVEGSTDVTEISGWLRLYKQSTSGSYVEVDSEYIDEYTNMLDWSGMLSTDGPGNYRLTFTGRADTPDGSEDFTISDTSSY